MKNIFLTILISSASTVSLVEKRTEAVVQGRVHRTVKIRVRCSLVRTVRNERGQQVEYHEQRIRRTVRTPVRWTLVQGRVGELDVNLPSDFGERFRNPGYT